MIIRFIRYLLAVVFSILYIPLNALLMKIQAWYLPMWHRDKVIYFCFAPFYWTYVGIVTIISYPYELLTMNLH